LLAKYDKVKQEAIQLRRKVEINNKHEEIENIFSKLSSLILANKANDQNCLKYKEKQLLNDLFQGNYPNPLTKI